MDVDVLRWFQQVADGTTVTEVSELSSATQPGVSRALSRLEREVGIALLRRSGRTLRMTRAGATFKPHVDAMLNSFDDGIAALAELAAPDTGTVSVAFQLSLGTWLVPTIVAGFRALHPDVRFDLHQLRDELAPHGLTRGEVDLEITTVRPHEPDVRWRPLLVEPLRLIVPAQHQLAGRPSVRLSEVAQEVFVMLRPSYALRAHSERLCRQAGFTARIGFEGDDLPTVQGFVAAGLGVAIVPGTRRGLGDPDAAALHYLPIDDDGAARQIGVAWSTQRRLLPAAQLFRRYVVDRAGSLG